MYCVKKITDDMNWVGGSDRRLALFENVFPIPRGVSYNAYVVMDEKTVLLDTVDKAVSDQFFENLAHVLDGRKLDYLVVNHMEPDHCGTMNELVLRHPEVKIVANAKTVVMIKQFFDFDIDSRVIVVKEGDTLSTGKHTFTFVMAPMVHWPEAMVTFDLTDKILYSADAFGTFGAINGNLFADEVDFEAEWLPDARRYYTNIVGKYGTQVQALLKKAANLEINMICSLHGPVWRKDIGWFIDKYLKWSSYTPEDEASVMIAYGSIYGNTENAANILASKLADAGVRNIAMYDVSATHPSVIVSEAFRCSHLVFASATYNAGIFCNMETVLLDLKAHNLQNRTVGIMQNGTWAPASGNLMKDILGSMKNMNVLETGVTIKSSVKDAQLAEIDALASALLETLKPKEAAAPNKEKIESKAMYNLACGLYVLTARDGEKDNGCITNTVMQVTNSPKRIVIAINKKNYTHDMVLKTGVFNLSVLTEETPFKVFEHFGFQSGRDVNKLADASPENRSENGLVYIPSNTNSFVSAKVVETEEFETHTMFTAEVTEAKVLSSIPSLTYEYYQKHTKPQAAALPADKKGYVCKICGYVYEGDPLPADFICPLCKHGAADFEKLN